MSFQSPEARLAIKINRRLDWNVGYQYYNYNESTMVGPRPQNYHAHLPYTRCGFTSDAESKDRTNPIRLTPSDQEAF